MASGVGWLQDKLFGEYQDEDTLKAPPKAAPAPPKAKKKGPGGGVGWLQSKLAGPYEDEDSTSADDPDETPPAKPTPAAKPTVAPTAAQASTPPVKKSPVTKPAPVAPAPKPAPAAPAPKPDPMDSVRADLLANKRADDAARAAAEKKRLDAEEFSKKLKSTTKRGASGGSGYEAYKSLMGE